MPAEPQRLVRHGARHLPDLVGVVLHPPRPREVLRELAICPGAQPRLLVEHQAGGAGRALVDRENHWRAPAGREARDFRWAKPSIFIGGTYRRDTYTRRNDSELATAVQEAGEVATGGAVLQLQLDLAHGQPGARGVDRHRGLHAEPGRERQQPRAGSSRASRAGPRSAPAARAPSASGSPSARTPPRPRSRRRARVANEATARSHRPSSTAATSGPSCAAERPRSPSHSTNIALVGPGSPTAPAAPPASPSPPSRRGSRTARAPRLPEPPPRPCRRRSRRPPRSRAHHRTPRAAPEPSVRCGRPRRGRSRGPPASCSFRGTRGIFGERRRREARDFRCGGAARYSAAVLAQATLEVPVGQRRGSHHRHRLEDRGLAR